MERLLVAFHDLIADFGTNHHLHFLMVDDGSTDGTAEQAKNMAGSLDLQVLSHDRNYGPGKAFATAFAYLAPRLKDDDWVATMEGDNTSRHELLRQMFMRTTEGYEVILASPYSYGGGIRNTAGIRVFLSHFANAFLKGCVGIHGIFTMSSFFRLFRGSALKRLQQCYGPGIMERTGFEAVVEMLIKMILLKMTISEVPMMLDTARRAGKSKMKVVKTIRCYLTLFLDRGRWVRQAGGYLHKPVEGLDEIVKTR